MGGLEAAGLVATCPRPMAWSSRRSLLVECVPALSEDSLTCTLTHPSPHPGRQKLFVVVVVARFIPWLAKLSFRNKCQHQPLDGMAGARGGLKNHPVKKGISFYLKRIQRKRDR